MNYAKLYSTSLRREQPHKTQDKQQRRRQELFKLRKNNFMLQINVNLLNNLNVIFI